MSAPNLFTLLNFSFNWRSACVAAAQANGIENIWTDMDPTNKTTPRVEIYFVQGAPRNHKTPGIALTGLTVKETPHDAFDATMTWRVVSNRDISSNASQHEILCAYVRALMLPFRHTFLAGGSTLPYYSLEMAKPMANREMIDSEKRLDMTDMPYSIVYSILASAWPATPEG